MAGSIINLFVGVGFVFGIIAALMAYFVTYAEYIHHYPTKREPRKMALQSAIFAFIFFFLVSCVAGFFYLRYIAP